MIIQDRKSVHVCYKLFGKSLLSHLVQEPSCYVIPGLRYEDRYKLCLIIGTVHYIPPVTFEDGITFNVHIRHLMLY